MLRSRTLAGIWPSGPGGRSEAGIHGHLPVGYLDREQTGDNAGVVDLGESNGPARDSTARMVIP